MRREIIARCVAARRFLEKNLLTFQEVKDYLETEIAKVKDCNSSCKKIVEDGKHLLHIRFFDDANDYGEYRSFEIEYITDSFDFSKFGITNANYYKNDGLPELNNRNRFGSRLAYIINLDGGKLLVSYQTIIAFFDEKSNICYLQPLARHYSNTTRRHIHDFLQSLYNPVVHYADL